MSGSGTNRMLQSENAMKKATNSALTASLMNANEEGKKMDIKNGKKAKDSKK